MGSLIFEKRGFGFGFGFAVVVVVCLISIKVSNASVHKVGDAAGWTTIGNVDYTHWALPKSFQLGDVIVFEYNPQFHNVMRVTHAEYKACNTSSPIATYATGNDSITIDTRGHHFFICGVPGHCQAGQKVDINVLRAPSVAPSDSGLTESPAPAATETPNAPVPPPTNGGSPLSVHFLQLLLLHFVWVVIFISK